MAGQSGSAAERASRTRLLRRPMERKRARGRVRVSMQPSRLQGPRRAMRGGVWLGSRVDRLGPGGSEADGVQSAGGRAPPLWKERMRGRGGGRGCGRGRSLSRQAERFFFFIFYLGAVSARPIAHIRALHFISATSRPSTSLFSTPARSKEKLMAGDAGAPETTAPSAADAAGPSSVPAGAAEVRKGEGCARE